MKKEIKFREEYLNRLAVELNNRLFVRKGFPIDLTKLKISCGFPSTGGTRSKGKTIGQCFATSGNGFNEVFIHPEIDNPISAGGVLVHELIHAVDDCKNGHGKVFRDIALLMGLEGKMTATTIGKDLEELLEKITNELGVYPHKSLKVETKKQSTRMIKLICGVPHVELKTGFYILRVSRASADFGIPSCPCGNKMEIAPSK